MNISNHHLNSLEVDSFHHLGFSTDTTDIKLFSDVKVIIIHIYKFVYIYTINNTY